MRFFYLLVISLGAICLVHAELVINEFSAAGTDLKDADGDQSDWIEIHNSGVSDINLSGWSLTDDIAQPNKWTFPAVNVVAGGYLVVFASGKNRTGAELHTNFSLNAQGEYLALIQPGWTKASEFNTYPEQKEGVSYGIASVDQTLVERSTPLKYVLSAPANDIQGDVWSEHDFDDSQWNTSSPQVAVHISVDVPKSVSTSTFSNAAVTSSSNVHVSGVPSPVSSVGLRFNISRSGNSHLRVTLTSPQGTVVTVFDDSSGVNAANFQVSLNNFNNEDLNGNWVLSMRESGGGFFGSATSVLNSWLLELPNGNVILNTGGIGYDTGGDYSDLIDTQVPNSTEQIWVRLPFELAATPNFTALTLRTRHDDGFEAYLNGALIHSDNVTPPIQTIEASSDFVDVNMTQHLSHLRVGQNVLAFRVVNSNTSSSDILMLAELVATTQQQAYRYSPQPTPGGANLQQTFTGFVADTKFALGRGFYSSPINETISCNTPGATLVYTTDGTLPTLQNGTQMSAPDSSSPAVATIPLSLTSSLRAAAFKDGMLATNVDTNSYIFPASVAQQSSGVTQNTYGFPSSWNGTTPDYGMDSDVVGAGDLFGGVYASSIESDLQSIPSVSVILPVDDMFGTNGIYSNPTQQGMAWERASSVEYIRPDGIKGFQIDCGIRIQGNASRANGLSLKNSFRLAFRKQYGKGKLKYDLYGHDADDEFDTLILRMHFNDGWSWGGAGGTPLFVREQFGHQMQLDTGHPSPHGEFVHMYINGVYWGLYNLRERPDSRFAASYFDIDADDWDGLNTGRAVNASDDPERVARAHASWDELVSRCQSVADAASTSARHSAYMDVMGYNADGSNNSSRENYLDVNNYIDYLLINFYMANADWPGRNFYVGRENAPDSEGFRFFVWDPEISMHLSQGASDQRATQVTVNHINAESGAANNRRDVVVVPFNRLRSSEAFRMKFADRAHRMLFNGGTLYVNPASPSWNPQQPENNRPAALFHKLTEMVKSPVVAESARWGDQHRSTPYTVNNEWTNERDIMLNSWLPSRSGNFIQHLKDADLYPNTEAPQYNQHGGTIANGFVLTMTAGNNDSQVGTIYYTTNGEDPLQINSTGTFSVSSSAQSYSRGGAGIVLNVSSTVMSRTLNNGEWSALNQAEFIVGMVPSSSSLVVSEFSYRPASPTPSEVSNGYNDRDDFEYIEIMNVSGAPLDLSAVEFDMGIIFDFSTITNPANRTLAVGERALIVEDIDAFQFRYGSGFKVLGQYQGGLSNDGETIRLSLKSGVVLHQWTYNDQLPWPTCADGEGYSLTLIAPETLPNHADPFSWRCSVSINGTPGGSDAIAFIGNPEADNDHDGLTLLLEYFLGSSDANAVDGFNHYQSGQVSIIDSEGVTQNYMTLSYRRNLASDDVVSQVERSTNLSNWETVEDGGLVLYSEVHHGDGTSTVTWRSTTPMNNQVKEFLRLRVSGR